SDVCSSDLGRVSTDPAGALDGLAGLQILVDREEVLDLQTLELIHVVNVTQVFLSWVRCRNAQQLVVTARFVTHTEHADGASADETARERRSLQQDEGVQGIAVLTECAFDEAVVGG